MKPIFLIEKAESLSYLIFYRNHKLFFFQNMKIRDQAQLCLVFYKLRFKSCFAYAYKVYKAMFNTNLQCDCEIQTSL